MKTSRKILLALAIIPIVFVGAIPLTLKWKLDNGDFTIANPQDNYSSMEYGFKMARFISLNGVDCVILPSDTIKADVEKQKADLLEFTEHGDTLSIDLKDPKGDVPRMRLYLQDGQTIIAANSKILLLGQLARDDTKSYSFHLTNSSIKTSFISDEERIFQFINEITADGSNSSIDLSGSVKINKLSITDIEDYTSGDQVSIAAMDVRYNNKSKVRSTGDSGGVRIVAE